MKIKLLYKFSDIDRAEWLEDMNVSLMEFTIIVLLGTFSIFGNHTATILFFSGFATLCSVLLRRSGASARQFHAAERLDAMRYRGLDFEAGQGTDENVRNLRDAGYRGYAIWLYRKLHPTSASRAAKAVDAL